MWNKSTREDIQALFAEADSLPGVERIFCHEGLVLRRDDRTSYGASPEYMRQYFQTDAGKAARKRYSASPKGKENQRRYRERVAARKAEALRVGEGSANLDVVDCAAQ